MPARLVDNPSLDAVEYEKALAELDDVTREQLLYGDWDVRPDGDVFKPGCFSTFIEPADFNAGAHRLVRRWDLAATKPRKGRDPDYTVGVLMGRSREGGIVVADVKRFRDRPEVVESVVAATYAQDGHNVAVRLEEEPGSSGKGLTSYYGRKIVFGANFAGVRTTGDKVASARPFASAANRGMVSPRASSVEHAFIAECEAFPEGVHDDQVDAAGHAYTDIVELYQPGGATLQPTSKSYRQGRAAAMAATRRQRPSLLGGTR